MEMSEVVMDYPTDSILHSAFCPAYGWMKDYRARLVSRVAGIENLRISILGSGGKGSAINLEVLPQGIPGEEELTKRWVERVVKMLLWQRGGSQVWLSDREDLFSASSENLPDRWDQIV